MRDFLGFVLGRLVSGVAVMLIGLLGVGLTVLFVRFALGAIDPHSIKTAAIIVATAIVVAIAEAVAISIMPSFRIKNGDQISHYEGWWSGRHVSLRPVTRDEQHALYLFMVIWVINMYFGFKLLLK